MIGALLCILSSTVAVPTAPKHVVVYHHPEKFAGWPANGGLWTWDNGKEVLVGFETGKFEERKGHNISGRHTNVLARTVDGGKTWTVETPDGYYQEGAKVKGWPDQVKFNAPGFAMRVLAAGYGVPAPGGSAVAISTDRGRTWDGPFALPGLGKLAELKGIEEITSRTDYIVTGPTGCLLMASSRPSGKGKVDRVFAARLTEAGQKVEFVGWVVSPTDPDRGVMPATVRVGDAKLVTTIRRRATVEKCWIDCYASANDGLTWKHLARVADTGKDNGNPPALVRLRDGRLCCVYGNRDTCRMLAKLSADDGATWSEEIVVRDGYRSDKFKDADLGYPRLFQRSDEKLVAIYYWADKDRPEPHIAATIFTLPAKR